MLCTVWRFTPISSAIFLTDGKDSFTQTSYGTNKPSIYYLIEVNGDNVGKVNGINGSSIIASEYMYGAWVEKNKYESVDLVNLNKYLYKISYHYFLVQNHKLQHR